jgi:hypothetical protein
VFGASEPLPFTYTHTELVGSDAISGTLGRVPGENVGAHDYTLGTLSAGTNYTLVMASSPATFSITSKPATVTLSNLNQTYDGTSKLVTVTTDPVGLAVTITYGGSIIPPFELGSYAVVATITDPNYTGTASGTLVIEQANATHSIPLMIGWNLISFNVHPEDTAIATVLSSIDSQYDLVYAWDATGGHAGAGNWMRFAPGIPGNTLTTLDESQGFWIRMKSAGTLVITGTVPTTTNINLLTTASGWNLVGYPSIVNRSMPSALETHGVTGYSLVYAYHANETDTWKRYAPDVPGNDLLEVIPGWAYWIKVTETSIWDVER